MHLSAFISVVNLIIALAILALLYKKGLKTQDELKRELMKMDEKAELKDITMLKKCLAVLTLTIFGFFSHQALHLESSAVALAGGFLLLLIAARDHSFTEKMLEKVEWATIFFFRRSLHCGWRFDRDGYHRSHCGNRA